MRHCSAHAEAMPHCYVTSRSIATAVPTTAMTRRSALAGMRRPSTAPTCPPTVEPTRSSTTASQTMCWRAKTMKNSAAMADSSGDRPRDEPERVRHVGRHGAVPDTEQGREGEQRPRPDDRVDRAGPEADGDDRDALQQGHGRSPVATGRVGSDTQSL